MNQRLAWHHAVMSSFAPVAAESVLWHERRSPPYPQLVLVPALMAVVASASVPGPTLRIVLASIALILAAVAWNVRGMGWIEDFTLTDRRLVVARPDGSSRSLELAEVRGASVHGSRVSFRLSSGEELLFGHVNRQTSLMRAFAGVAPDAAVEYRPASLCPT